MSSKYYIYTEAYNCGPILNECLRTFFKYHPDAIVNVFGLAQDLASISQHPINFIDVGSDKALSYAYQHGHQGTAHLWARVIQDFSKDAEYIIHFDSDVIFRKESLSLLVDKLEEGYGLVGPRRCYKHNLNGKTNLGNQEDTVCTYFMGFKKVLVSEHSHNELRDMIVGKLSLHGKIILDFFDPVSYEITHNGGDVSFLDYDLVGSFNELGSKTNKYGEINSYSDFGEHLVHFAGVGSGYNYYNSPSNPSHPEYMLWAVGRYLVYHRLFIDNSLNAHELNNYDQHTYNIMKEFLWNS